MVPGAEFEWLTPDYRLFREVGSRESNFVPHGYPSEVFGTNTVRQLITLGETAVTAFYATLGLTHAEVPGVAAAVLITTIVLGEAISLNLDL